jgi:hypothetical protein
MVTQEKLINSAVLRYRLGSIFVWLGVFAWAPFIFLRAIGERPSFLVFLGFHLLGVIGGSRLRSVARKELGMLPPKKSILHMAGHVMILLGILVWVPYLYLKLAMGQPIEAMNFLPFHLAGVLGGVLLHLLNYILQRRAKN